MEEIWISESRDIALAVFSLNLIQFRQFEFFKNNLPVSIENLTARNSFTSEQNLAGHKFFSSGRKSGSHE